MASTAKLTPSWVILREIPDITSVLVLCCAHFMKQLLCFPQNLLPCKVPVECGPQRHVWDSGGGREAAIFVLGLEGQFQAWGVAQICHFSSVAELGLCLLVFGQILLLFLPFLGQVGSVSSCPGGCPVIEIDSGERPVWVPVCPCVGSGLFLQTAGLSLFTHFISMFLSQLPAQKTSFSSTRHRNNSLTRLCDQLP